MTIEPVYTGYMLDHEFELTGRCLLRPRRAGRVTRDFFWTDHAMREQWHVYKGIGYHTRAQAAQAAHNE